MKLENINNKILNGIVASLDNYILEGLKRKGFEFKDRFEIEMFIKENCKVVDNEKLKEKTFYVNKTPFFLHKYETKVYFNIKKTSLNTIAEASLGTFYYL
jgi:hypothetical protein